jgi:hypothetical protein
MENRLITTLHMANNKTKCRFYLPSWASEQLSWPLSCPVTGVEDQEGNLLLTYNEKMFTGRYLEAPYYTVVTLPERFKTEDKIRVDIVDDSLLIKL